HADRAEVGFGGEMFGGDAAPDGGQHPGSRAAIAQDSVAEPDLRPIRVVRPGMGADGLFVAPGQRLRVTGAGVEALFGAGLTLAEAADLVGLPDVSIPRWSGPVGYYTLTVDGTALVAAHGLWCEPLRPRPVDGREVAPLADARRLLSPCEAALLAAAP
ncbi:MAG: Hint domain-containing protein, partial [Pseudomonadota bacterium]